jgi:hypothetical protein
MKNSTPLAPSLARATEGAPPPSHLPSKSIPGVKSYFTYSILTLMYINIFLSFA